MFTIIALIALTLAIITATDGHPSSLAMALPCAAYLLFKMDSIIDQTREAIHLDDARHQRVESDHAQPTKEPLNTLNLDVTSKDGGYLIGEGHAWKITLKTVILILVPLALAACGNPEVIGVEAHEHKQVLVHVHEQDTVVVDTVSIEHVQDYVRERGLGGTPTSLLITNTYLQAAQEMGWSNNVLIVILLLIGIPFVADLINGMREGYSAHAIMDDWSMAIWAGVLVAFLTLFLAIYADQKIEQIEGCNERLIESVEQGYLPERTLECPGLNRMGTDMPGAFLLVLVGIPFIMGMRQVRQEMSLQEFIQTGPNHPAKVSYRARLQRQAGRAHRHSKKVYRGVRKGSAKIYHDN